MKNDDKDSFMIDYLKLCFFDKFMPMAIAFGIFKLGEFVYNVLF